MNYINSRGRGMSSMQRIEVEGCGVRRYEQEFYGVALGYKELSKSSEKVQRAWRIYEREGKLEKYVRYLEKKYGLEKDKKGKIRAVERRKVIEGREKEEEEKYESGEYWVLRSVEKYMVGGMLKKVYEGWSRTGRGTAVDKLLYAKRYFVRPKEGGYDKEKWELVRVKVIESK